MANEPASRQTVLQLAETLKTCMQKCDHLSEQMSALQLQLAEQKGQAMPNKVDAMDQRVRSLEDTKARLWGAIALLAFFGLGGIAAVLKLYSK